jgi:hypothetical protein
MLDEPGQVLVEGSDLARSCKHMLWLFLSSFSLSDLLCEP